MKGPADINHLSQNSEFSCPSLQDTVQTVKTATPIPIIYRKRTSRIKAPALPIEDSIDSFTPRNKGMILLVEDNHINLKLLAAYMCKLSQPYILAANGQEALDIYTSSTEKIGLVIMDVQMPVMDGLESTREIRRFELDQGMSPAAVVALTAAAGEEVRKEAYSSGMDAFLVKPVEMKTLRRVVHRFREGGRSALREFGEGS
jgi:CheY-like chemotaxis protein